MVIATGPHGAARVVAVLFAGVVACGGEAERQPDAHGVPALPFELACEGTPDHFTHYSDLAFVRGDQANTHFKGLQVSEAGGAQAEEGGFYLNVIEMDDETFGALAVMFERAPGPAVLRAVRNNHYQECETCLVDDPLREWDVQSVSGELDLNGPVLSGLVTIELSPSPRPNNVATGTFAIEGLFGVCVFEL